MRYWYLIVLVALVGCAAGSPTESGRSSQSEEVSVRPDRSPSLGQPTPHPPATGGTELTGTLGADSVEGGCAYLQTADGTRYQVLYPRGWSVSQSPLQLVDPEGQVVARGGDPVTVRGHEADEMVSICQIGPIFRATEVVIGS